MKPVCSCSLILLIAVFASISCTHQQSNRLFTRLDAKESGISFSNDIHDDDSSYSFINEFGYMGGGVGIGDFNNDGLPDIFFTGNQVSCRLYINKGNNRFADVTGEAGITTEVWCTGVSIVDINNDGYDDIYVSVFGKDLRNRSKNLLFINQHDLTFKEEAEAYGLADTGYSTQAVFLDYDNDGDLDMYLANYLLSSKNGNSIYPRDKSGRSPANDKLYRNDGDTLHQGHPLFTDVTLEAGIKEDGYGLGVSVSDFNNDGWPDIYVGNDFLTNDELWLNNRNGTFSNCIDKALRHQSYSTMGTDAADINNDGLTDIVTLDMLPEDNERKKTSFSFMKYERYEAERAMGYEPEFVRNMLQLNNGNRDRGDTALPFFSEIGELSGINATDWSWSVLLADFDNDGWKDMHITNGIGRDFINGDFLEFSNTLFNGTLSREEQEKKIRQKLASLHHVNLPNYLYINRHDLRFADESKNGGINEPSMSNGAAYADLDNDGDLDLIVNNINQPAFVFINNTNQKNKPATSHFMRINLKGINGNRAGIGSKVYVYDKGIVQLQEQNPARGYFSSVDQRLVFGLAKNDHADSVLVVWPDGKRELRKNVIADTVLAFSWQDAIADGQESSSKSRLLFTDVTSTSGILYVHQDNPENDFATQRLLPQKYSQLGPFITTGDIDHDGTTDFFIGGAFNFSGKIFTQQPGQLFKSTDLSDSIKYEEDMDCILFDADNDGDSDLLITGGDLQYSDNSIYYKPRLYLNDGDGNFSLRPELIPDSVRTLAGTVVACDYDGDGDKDLFIGGRVSKKYPLSPRSYLLQNENGVFKDATAFVCPALQNAGMITAAVWTDFNNDNQPDLIIGGEWMPLRFFQNKKGKLFETTDSTGLAQMNGLWRSLTATDIDNDGDIDLVAGNLGLNCNYRVDSAGPMDLYATDLDGNGSIDPVPFYYIIGKDGERHSYPGISRNLFAEQVPAIKKHFLLYEDYAQVTFNDIFNGKAKDNMLHLFCNETRTCYFENTGNGKFLKHPLPVEAQFAPVNAIICDDLDNDGYKDILLAGNEYQAEVTRGRYDASYGCFLRGNRNKSFTPVKPVESGFIVDGDVKDMSLISLSGGQKLLLVAVNNDSLKVFRIESDLSK